MRGGEGVVWSNAPVRCRLFALHDGELVLLHYGCALDDRTAVTRRWTRCLGEPSRTCNVIT